MRRFRSAAAIGLALSVVGLAGCESTPSLHLDPLSTNGRNGHAPVISYDATMHIETASRTAGD
jgi:hypothetical protein